MQEKEKIKRKKDIRLFKNDNDVERLAEFIIKKDIYGSSTAYDPYWDNQTEVLIKALLLYIFHEIATEKQTYSMLLEMLDCIDATEILFENLKKKKPDHIALKYYKEYENIPVKTRVSVITNLRVKLESLDIESLTD